MIASRRDDRTVPVLMILCAAASLLHFVHNAVDLREYPNLPAWITPPRIAAAWCGVTVIGAVSYWLYRRVSRVGGALAIATYGVLGFGGLDHYAMAPVAAHSLVMNATIAGEVAAATALLIVLARSILRA